MAWQFFSISSCFFRDLCLSVVKLAWLSGCCVRLESLDCSRLQILILHRAAFLLIRGLFLLFLFHVIELLFGRVLASVCEAQLLLCLYT